MLGSLVDDQRASEAQAAFIVYLLDPELGVARMAAGLRSSVPLARIECAAALALVDGSNEHLRAAETPEAGTILALLRGEEPRPGPEPRGTLVSWKGRPTQVYSIRELLELELEGHAFAQAKAFWRGHEPMLRRWDAS